MHGPKPSEHDARRRVELRRMRGIASGLLLLMLVVYVATRLLHGRPGLEWLSFVEAFAEAAMVGAIADWFAVTALFRHPFGVPIPHTAIVPRNKDRLGIALGRFVANNFLTAETLAHKLETIDVAGHLATWLSKPGNARMLSERLSAGVPAVIDALGEDHVRDVVRRGMVTSLRRIDVAPVAGKILGILVANRRHQALFDRMIELAGDFLRANHETIRAKISARSKWWWPKFVDEQLYHKIIDGIEDTLMELRDPHHGWREQFNAAAEEYVARLSSGESYRARGEAIKEEILSNPVVGQYVDSVWADIRERLRSDAADPEGSLRHAVEAGLTALGQRLATDEAMRLAINRWVRALVVRQVVPQRDRIGNFFSGVVHRWDTGTVVEKIELLVGRDLQYVRINGTLVGGTVGLIIHTVTVLVG